MEPVSLAIGIPTLVKSCIEAYRAVSVMLALNEDAVGLKLQVCIEETRLRLWGRFWGILDENLHVTQKQEVASSRIDIDEYLELPGVESLVREILLKIDGLLKKCKKYATRYQQPEKASTSDQGAQSLAVPHEILRPSSPGKNRSLGARLRWAIADKSSFTQTLTSLVELNDGLEKMLPRHGRLSLKHALVGELLSETLDPLGQMRNRKGAVVNAAAEGSAELDAGLHSSEQSQSDFDLHSIMAKYEAFLLPMEWFKNLSIASSGQTLEHFTPPSSFVAGQGAVVDGQSVGDNDTADPVAGPQKPPTEVVLVEWKMLDTSLAKFLQTRTFEIAKLFHQHGDNHDKNESYTLSCIGYVRVPKQSPGAQVSGLVFRLPEDYRAAPAPTVVSLADMLDADFRSGAARAPDLNVRLALARNLCDALYQVQCTGWVHRMLSSRSVIFFARSGVQEASSSANLDKPYLAGWQSSRQDDQVIEKGSEGFDVGKYDGTDILFVHPKRSMTRFRRSHDIYSLGIILIEIAFWEPISAWHNAADGSVQPSVQSLTRWSDKVYTTVRQELGAEVGTAYRDAVLWCLRGPEQARLKESVSVAMELNTEEREIGIEKDFFWQVLRRLDSTRYIT
ncbi:hypothetical protein SLS58_002939 [Diplodia intermedia]|uniref:Prion-inhibition and propagation HeLo domain-containing protein n=1 Tax=Diplodia intermedia TaxID=856260 RepID=A0ABR3TYY7_9PEZI